MGIMDVITLDDTADSSLFVIDETPVLEEIQDTNTRRRAGQKKKGMKRSKNSYIVMGGTISDNEMVVNIPKPRKKKKKNNLETIVIDDEESDGVIELSDEEEGVMGGEITASFETIQQRLANYQIRQFNNLQRRNELQTKNNWKKRLEKLDIPPKKDENQNAPIVPKAAPAVNRKLRPIVIDGSNVAFGHGNRTVFSSRGIEICCNYFLSRGHKVKVFVPQYRRRHHATMDTHILDKLEQEKILIFTPSRKINGKTVASYDDRMMVEYAAQSGAIIVTRDNLRDIASESDDFLKIVNERILMFTWADEDIILFPNDPLGRKGPVLADFLSFPPEETEENTKTDEKSNTNETPNTSQEPNTNENPNVLEKPSANGNSNINKKNPKSMQNQIPANKSNSVNL